REIPRLDVAERVEWSKLGQLRANLAAVRRRLPETESSLDRQAVARSRIGVEVDPVEPLILRAEVVGGGDVVVGLSEERGVDVVERSYDVAAAAGKTRIDRRGDVELSEIRRRDREVVGGDEALEPPADVADFNGDARQHFLLHRDPERPVRGTRAP